jgi:P pilus assembly chaperone PapD
MNRILTFITLALMFTLSAAAQSVSIAPSRMYFKVTPGQAKAQTLKVTNNSKDKQSFTITFGDFSAPGSEGKSTLLKPGESPNSITKNVSASPSFFELEPGKSQDVQILLELPSLPESNKVKWGTILVKLVKEKTEAKKGDASTVGMGILETFQFVVHIFQTPPNITKKQAEIISFKQVDNTKGTEKMVSILTKNTGDAILDCAAYIELVNLNTGKKERLKPNAFTVLPGGSREMKFVIPSTQEKGKYTLTGVVDYGSKEDVQAAEMDLEI